MEAEYLAMRRI